MRGLRIEKVTLNIGCGDNAEKLERAQKLLEYLTGRKPVITRSKRRSTFGVAKGKPIGTKVTLRKKAAEEFFKKVVDALDKKFKASFFDDEGNINIGIKEYIDLPGVKYQHKIGMMGLNVSVTLERKGFRVKRRRIQKKKIPRKERIKKEEAMEWVKKNYGVEIVE